MPASGEAISIPSASGISLIAGGDRRVALGALVVEDEQEHQREARQAVDEGGGAGGREQAVAEDLEVEHRRARAALDQRPRAGSSTAAAARPPITIGSFQPLSPPRETPSTRPGEADDEGAGAEHVVAAHGVRLGELAQDQRAPDGAGERERAR